MILAKPNIKYINTVTHEGKVLIVASVVEAGGTKLVYTVKQDGFEDSALQNPTGSGWEDFKALSLPDDSVGDPSVAEKESQDWTDTSGNYLLRSVYKSADLTAPAPVQLVSHNGYVYLFRQSTRGTLLVDRFVLDGMTNSLNPTLEVRYRRSRQRYKPIKAMKINSGGQMEAIDALDFRDMQNQPFYEPTTEIGPKLLNGLLDGWFGVVVNPTQEVEGYRWHFFVYNAQSQRIDTLTLHSGDEQIFTLRDNTSVSIDELTNAVTYIRVPGIIQQKIALQDSGGDPLLVNNGLAAVKYDVQYEDQTATGPQLLRDASKIMLAVPTDDGIATLSFAIADDGTLAQIVPEVQNTLLRSRQSEVLLPLTVLDNIRAVGDTQPAPSGTIVGMSRSTDDATAEQVRVQVADADQAALAKLSRGDVIKLANTTSYNGLYRVASVTDNNAFTINAPFQYGEVGDWEKVETADTGLIFDGMISGYEKVGAGLLQVNALNHGLETGDWVQIVDSPDLAGEYPILTQDANSFTVQRLWVNGDAVNLKLESRKRRGLVFDGKADWIEVPLSAPLTLTTGFALEAWVKLNSAQNQTILATVPDAPYTQGGVSRGWQATLGVNNGKFSFAFVPLNLPGITPQRLDSPTPAALNQWVHVACTLDDKVLRLLENGVVVATLPIATLDKAALDAYTAWLTLVRADVKEQEATTALHALPAQHPANYDRGRLVVRQSGKALSGELGATLVLAAANEQTEQQWRLEGVRASGTQGATTTFAIYNLATQLVLDSSGQQVAWQNLDSQLWLLDSTGDGYFQLRCKQNNLVLSEQGGQLSLQAALLPDSPALVQQQWWFEALGEGKVNRIRTVLKLLEANQPRTGTGITFSVPALTLAGQIAAADVGKAVKSPQLLLQGQLAEVRLWSNGRTDQDILNNMHLRLTGREVGLVGDWPLGGVSVDEENNKQVFDFSVAGNQGIVYGAPYGGGVTLGRTLRDNVTLATKYSNDDLFAVRTVTYVESFEFRTDIPVAPQNADGKGGAIFKPSIWGQMSRSAETRQPVPPFQPDFQFEALADGWYRATCRFLPQGVRLVRCFELSDVRGNWHTLEIRRHQIQYISSVVTASQIESTAKVPSLVNPLAGLTDPIATVRQIEYCEQEEAALVTRQKELEALLAAWTDDTAARSRLADLMAQAEGLKSQIALLEAAYNQLVISPLGYWFKIGTNTVTPIRYIHPDLHKLGGYLSTKLWEVYSDSPFDGYLWKVESIGNDEVRIRNKLYTDYLLCVLGSLEHPQEGYVAAALSEDTMAARDWKLEQVEGGRFRMFNVALQKYIFSSGVILDWDTWRCGLTESAEYSGTIWEFEKTDQELETLSEQRAELERLKETLKPIQDEIDQLNAALGAAASQKTQWEQELQQIKDQLVIIRQRISQLTTSYLNLVVSLNTTAQAMPNLLGQADPQGLKVQAALLPFAQAASRLHALESCTGHVALTYLDQWGQLHQTRYDTAYDADGKGEEWLADTYRAALVLNGNRLALTLPTRIFSTVSTQITIEFWAKGGSNLPQALTFLGATDGQNNSCLRIQLPNEKGEIVWEAGTKPDSGAIDRLTQPAAARLYRERWTHWAFVKDSDKGEMKIYVNGRLWYANNPKEKDGVTLKQPISPITRAALAGLPGDSSSWQGQLAELRIWNVALAERELEANSRLLLQGTEPGLMVYYPLNEAQGDLARDVTGQGRHLTVTGSSWAACSAPIGRLHDYFDLLEKPTQFDGQKTFIRLPRLNLDCSEGLTLEALVWFDAATSNSHIIDLGNGSVSENIRLTKVGTNLAFMIVNKVNGNSQLSYLEAPNVLLLNEWVYIVATIQKSGLATLYVNGVGKASGQMSLPVTTLRTSNFIGKSDQQGDPLFQGQMKFVRLYESALSAAEIGDYAQQHAVGQELLNVATLFDGKTKFVQLPALNKDFSQGFTVEALVCFDEFQSWSRIIDLGNGPGSQNILLANEVTTNNLSLMVINNGQQYLLKAQNALPKGGWVYVAATIQADGTAKLYINGAEKASGQMALPITVTRNQCYVGKSNWNNDALFKGQMNFVRLWNQALSPLEIARAAQQYCYSEPACPFPLLNTYTQFDGKSAFVQLPEMNVDFSQGLTMVAHVRFDAFNAWARIIDFANGRGDQDVKAMQDIVLMMDGSTNGIYWTVINNGQASSIHASNAIPLGEWVYIAVTIQKNGMASLYVNGVEKVSGQMALPLTTLRRFNYIGKSNWTPTDALFQGQMNFVHLWNHALSPTEIFHIAQKQRLLPLLNTLTQFDGKSTFVQLPAMNADLSEGLTIEAHVRFEALQWWSRIIDLGNGPKLQNIVLANVEATNHLSFAVYDNGKLYELRAPNALRSGEWLYVTATIQPDGLAKLYVNGVEKASGPLALPATVLRTLCYVGKSNWPNDALFKGQMDLVRLWRTVLDPTEIWRNAQTYNPRPLHSSALFIGTEYSRVMVDGQQRKDAMMMRTLAWATDEGVRLLDQQRIEALDLKWIGNAQIKPTLIGYIEGAPPVPSENLTQEDKYNGAASVELVQSSDVAYSWTREDNASEGAEMAFFAGEKSKTEEGGGFLVEFFTSVEETEAKVGASFNFAYYFQQASTVSTSHILSKRDRLELRGNQELEANFPVLGKRFIPKNVGYALVTSGLADIFVSKLRRTGRMVGYQVLPVEGVPMDVNTITFLINPAYTMAGSLDGMTGTQATSQRFFRQVPEMRAQYGSLYPASYLRLAEAYRLKADIERQDQRHQAYFNQFDSGLVDRTSLAIQVGSDTDTPLSVNTPGSDSGASYSALGEIDKKIAAKEDEIATLQKATPADQAAIDRCKAELESLQKERSQLLQQQQSDLNKGGSARQQQIESTYTDVSTRAHATASFADWQRNMENLQVRAGKRNIVNTYVWDGDGGLHVEEQQFASTVEHSIGGSFEMDLGVGGEMSLAFGKALVEAKFINHATLTQTMNKTEADSTGMELHVDLSGVESRGITDYNDYPLLPGEKVDRYRFMSFFLENNTDHWHDFFDEVVDPEWLNSNDEEARALRETRNGRPNKVWRVLHRVTYVERPSLMGFGRQIPNTTSTVTTLQQLRAQVKELNKRLDLLQNDLMAKLDQVLSKLSK